MRRCSSRSLGRPPGIRHAPLALSVFALVACSATPAKPPEPPPKPVEAPLAAAEGRAYELHAGVDPIPNQCTPHARELCNAMDDDCNGVIDDGCGYATGAVQVTIGWDTGADIDLYVTDPSGETVYYNEQHVRSAMGGYLDHSARGNCRREQTHSRVENAYWPAPRSGVYRLQLHYFSPCGDISRTAVTMSVAVSGKLVGTYRYQLEPEERIDALSFEIP